MDQVLPAGGDEGAVVRGQAHRLGLLVTHAVGRLRPRHVARVGLVQRHQVELREAERANDPGDKRAAAVGRSRSRVPVSLTRPDAELIRSVASPLLW